MFFDSLESRSMFSVTIPTTQIASIPSKVPPIVVPLSQATPVKSVTVAPTAAQSKALVTAVIDSETKLLSDVLAGKLSNLQTDLTDLKSKAAKAGGELQSLLGSTVSVKASLPSSQLNALRSLGSTAADHLGNLLGQPQINGDRNSQVSADPTETTLKGVASTAAAVKVGAEMGALPLSAIFSGGGAGAGAVATATGGVAAAAGAGVIVGTAIDKATTAIQGESIGENWGDVYGAGYYDATKGGDFTYYTDAAVNAQVDLVRTVAGWVGSFFSSGSNSDGKSGTPLPADTDNTSSGFITAQELKDALAKLASKGMPANTDDTSGGTGGALNTGASGTGKVNSQAQYVNDTTASTSINITVSDLAALAIRLTSKM